MRGPLLPRRSPAGTLFAVLVAAVTAMLVAPPPAWAHSQLLGTAPAASATMTGPVPEVTLTFNEHVHQQFSIVVVRGPGGVSYSDGHVRVVDAVVHQPVYPLRSGSYTVEWRVVSADTHPVQGKFGFTVALPPGQEPTVAPSAPAPSRLASATNGRSTPWWPWLLAIAVLIVVVLIFVRRRGRFAGGSERQEP